MKFYKDEIMDIILENKIITLDSLLSFNGINKQKVAKLVEQNDIYVNEEGYLYPRTLLIIRTDRVSKRFVEQIPINYITEIDLNKIITYDEDDEDFLEGVNISEDQRDLFEAPNSLIFDFYRNEYTLLVRYVNLNYSPLNGLNSYSMDRKFTVVHLDGYSLYAKGLEMGIKDRFYQEFEWNHFTTVEEAMGFIRVCFNTGKRIDFIITEINVPNSSGLEFARLVKALEEELNFPKIPIISVSMQGNDSPKVAEGISNGLFIQHFPKSTQLEVIGDFINTLDT